MTGKHSRSRWSIGGGLIALVAGLILVMVATPGCGSSGPKPVGAKPPDRAGAVETTAAGIGESAANIDLARADAVEKAPEVQPESDRIGFETERLRQYQADLAIAVKDLRATQKHVEELTKAVADRDAEIVKVKAEAERERTGLLRWIFGGMAGLALVGAVVAVLWLRNMPLAITCGGVVAACIGATYLIAWAKWLAIGLLVLMALATAYALWQQRKVAREVVLTAEKFKTTDPNDKSAMEAAAATIQSAVTREFVKRVREPIKKKLAEREAFER